MMTSTLEVIDTEITGFELQLQGQLTEQMVHYRAGYSYLDGEQVDRSGQQVCVRANCQRTCSRFGIAIRSPIGSASASV